MIHDWGLITVSYQDDLVFSQGQSFPSGSLLVQLLNCFREYDTNREILGYIPRLSHLQYEMEHSRCQSMVFENARLAIISILESLPMLPSFSALEIEDEQTYINELFSESTRLEILSYFENKIELARLRSIRREEIDDVMAIFAEHDYTSDDETIALIAQAINRKPEIVRELLQGGLRNMGFVDFYQRYGDEYREEWAKEAHATSSTDPYHIMLRMDLEEALLTAFENLDYRERAIVSEHLGFCPECFGDYQLVIDELGRIVKKRIKPKPFIDIALDHGLSSPSSADRIYRKALDKMRKAIREKTGA